jgi:hypothetical protein
VTACRDTGSLFDSLLEGDLATRGETSSLLGPFLEGLTTCDGAGADML